MKTIQVKINGEWRTIDFVSGSGFGYATRAIQDIRLLNESECEHEYQQQEVDSDELVCVDCDDRIKLPHKKLNKIDKLERYGCFHNDNEEVLTCIWDKLDEIIDHINNN